MINNPCLNSPVTRKVINPLWRDLLAFSTSSGMISELSNNK